MGRRMNSSETFIHRWDHAAARAHVVFPLVLQNFMFMERCNARRSFATLVSPESHLPGDRRDELRRIVADAFLEHRLDPLTSAIVVDGSPFTIDEVRLLAGGDRADRRSSRPRYVAPFSVPIVIASSGVKPCFDEQLELALVGEARE